MQEKYCPVCGVVYSAEADYCARCQAKLLDMPKDGEEEPKTEVEGVTEEESGAQAAPDSAEKEEDAAPQKHGLLDSPEETPEETERRKKDWRVLVIGFLIMVGAIYGCYWLLSILLK